MSAPAGVTMLMLALPAHAEQVLRRGGGIEPDTLDPHKTQALEIDHDLFEGLAGIAPGGQVVPGAAARWEVSGDGRAYVFHLRPDARWSNGDPLTADDFVAGLRRAVTPATGSGYAQVLSPIANVGEILAGRAPPEMLGVEALDPATLRIRLQRPTPYLPSLLALPVAAPLHRPSFAQHGAQFARAGNLVGNGAYALAEWVLHSHVKLVRNRHYWNDAQTQIDTVYYYPTENQDSEIKRYRAGELDVTYRVPFSEAQWLRANLGSELRLATYLATLYVAFNCTQPPFAEQPGLRRALSMVIDREAIARKLLHGLGVPAPGWVPPEVAGYDAQRPDWADWPMDRRIAEARRLYAAAGYSEQRPLEFELRYFTREDNRRLATVLAALWRQRLGARVRLVNEEFKVFLANARQKAATQAVLANWLGDYDDATTFADILRGGGGQNYAGWRSDRYEALLDGAAGAADVAQRRALLEQAERVVLEEVPIAPVYHFVSRHLVKPHVAGWQDNVLDYHFSKDLRIVPR
jgi:oligopeptide transport system substrate-binding protein